HPAVGEQRRGTVGEGGGEEPGQVDEEIEVAEELTEGGRAVRRPAESGELLPYRREPQEGVAQRAELAGRRAAGGGAAGQAVDVADPVKPVAERGAAERLADRALHGVEPAGDLRRIAERGEQPLAEEPRPHRRHGAIEDLEYGDAPGAGAERLDQLEVSPGHLVEPEMPAGPPDRRAGEMG